MATDASVDKLANNLFTNSDVKTEKFYSSLSVSVPRVLYLESQVQCVDVLTDISSLCRITISLQCLGLFSASDISFLLTQ